MISHKISLAIATVFTILSGTVLPSHADRSCPLGFTSGLVGCEKVVKVTSKNICPNKTFRLDIRVGLDRCIDNTVNIQSSIEDKSAKYNAVEKIRREIDPGFTNPGDLSRQPKVIVVSRQLLIDHDSMTKQDYTEITFNIIIPRNSPF
jgi:hypothetical protein